MSFENKKREKKDLMACVRVSLLDRCVSQPQVFGGRGINPCPSALQVAASRAAAATAQSEPFSVSPSQPHLAVSVAAAAAALTVKVTELDKPTSKSCLCSHRKLPCTFIPTPTVLALSHPTFFPIYPFSLLYPSPKSPAPGQGHFTPSRGPGAVGVRWGARWGEGWVSVCISLSRSRLWSYARRPSVTGVHAVQPALPAGF